jgi:NTE family protein
LGLSTNLINLALGGGGVKGIAYIGAFEEARDRGYKWGNVAGVSAGALAGAFISAGMSPYEIWRAVEKFDFEGVQLSKVYKKVPVIERYLEFIYRTRIFGADSISAFFNQRFAPTYSDYQKDYYLEGNTPRGNLLKNIATFAREGSLFDGDYLEEWLSKSLMAKGVRTFGDLKGGIVDKENPKGYKLRVTAVDCNRAKLVVIPDDLEFYNIDADSFEVSKAIRISTCIPFAFKPVELQKREENVTRTYNLIDGGILDRFPHWLINAETSKAVGFTLRGQEKPGFFSLNTTLEVLRSIILSIQNMGNPKEKENKIKYVGEIVSPKVSLLDFNLNIDDKVHLFNLGKEEAFRIFNKLEEESLNFRRNILRWYCPIIRKRWL